MAPGMASALGFTLALALGFAMMPSEAKKAGGNALLQLLQLEIQVFHWVHLLSIWIFTTEITFDSFLKASCLVSRSKANFTLDRRKATCWEQKFYREWSAKNVDTDFFGFD
jgi:hypothetical protein